MKKYCSIIGALITFALAAAAQTTGSTPGSTAPNTGQGNAADPPGTTLPPGLEKRHALPPGLQNGDQLPPGLTRGTNHPAAEFGATNQFGVNGVATNNFAATNQFGVGATPLHGTTNQFGNAPINRPRIAPMTPTGGTNRVYGTNMGVIGPTNLSPTGRTNSLPGFSTGTNNLSQPNP